MGTPRTGLLLTLLASTAMILAGCTDNSHLERDDETATLPVDPNASGGATSGPGSSDQTSEPDRGFAPIGQTKNGAHAGAPGIDVQGTMDTCDAGFCLDASAANDGEHDYVVHGTCESPWATALYQGDERVMTSEPMAHCMGFSDEPFGPGSSDQRAFTWDGRLWNDDAGAYEDAPDGGYTWILSFTVFTDEHGEGRVTIEVPFDVIVGES